MQKTEGCVTGQPSWGTRTIPSKSVAFPRDSAICDVHVTRYPAQFQCHARGGRFSLAIITAYNLSDRKSVV